MYSGLLPCVPNDPDSQVTAKFVNPVTESMTSFMYWISMAKTALVTLALITKMASILESE